MGECEASSCRLVCYKCGSLLLDQARDLLVDSHGQVLASLSPLVEEGSCDNTSVWYVRDEGLPQWVSSLVEESGWTKGRINCPACHCRVGGFDYVGGDRCSCTEASVLPSLHFTRSKVDLKVATLV